MEPLTGQRLPGGPCAVRRRQARRCAAASEVTGSSPADEKRLFGAPVGLAQAAGGAVLMPATSGNAMGEHRRSLD
ncbi:hypothetical protein ACPA9J_19165 [Pseudomonas aeruginosa]